MLVPSFSSKGFGKSDDGQSGIRAVWDITTQYLTDCMLISAYDIHGNHIPAPVSAITDIIIVDSGGYEISPIQDMSTVYLESVADAEWSLDKLSTVYDAWPSHVPAVFVNYDHHKERQSLAVQVESARELFGRYPSQLRCFLAKPETTKQRFLQLGNLKADVQQFSDFDFLGVTEKELGSSTLERMKNLADLRLALDDGGLHTPIHVFGSLDPIGSLLYFLAGAEVFDGLTWLRYAFVDGRGIYWSNYGALKVGIDRKDELAKASMMRDNISYLVDMRNQMMKFVIDSDYAHFGAMGNMLKDAYSLLRTRNKRLT